VFKAKAFFIGREEFKPMQNLPRVLFLTDTIVETFLFPPPKENPALTKAVLST
jgi:hypothetical protein